MENKKLLGCYTNSYSHSGFHNGNLEIFPDYASDPKTFPGLRNGNWNFPVYIMKFFRYTEQKPDFFPECSGILDHDSGNFMFPFRKPEKIRKPVKIRFPFHPEISWNSTLGNKFPDHSISKMDFFPRKNGNHSFK